MSNRYNSNSSFKYSLRNLRTTDFLAFRDLPNIISARKSNLYAIDYGCGAGRSTRFLKEIGYHTIGFDTNWNMLLNACLKDTTGLYVQIKSSEISLTDCSVDLVLCSFVLMEIPSKDEILGVLIEFNRVLKANGKAVIIANTGYFYKGQWVSSEVNFPENSGDLRSGQQVRVRLIPENIVLNDYFWTDADYKGFFESAGFKIQDEIRPLGSSDDNIEWLDEFRISPHVVYIAEKEK